MIIPTKGLCYGAFLLTYAANVKSCGNYTEWVETAKGVPAYMTEALDIKSAADQLIEIGLAKTVGNRIVIDPSLVAAGNLVSKTTLAAIAKVLMGNAPPPWLTTAVIGGQLRWELVPSSDSKNLAWLEDFLEPLIYDLNRNQEEGEEFRTWLGSVGEDVVVANENNLGRVVSQVSLISDAFGYDIESTTMESRRCIEVKTTLETRAETFYITKNETRKAAELKDQWRLVQIVLNPVAVTQEQVTATNVKIARTLDAPTVLSLVPIDTDTGLWIETAIVRPPPSAWTLEPIHLPDDWIFPGYRTILSLL